VPANRLTTPMTTGIDLDQYRRICVDVYRLFNQDKWWFPKGAPRTPIAEMADTHRWNTARMLLRGARNHEWRYSFGETYAMGDPILRDVTGGRFSHFDLMGEHAQDAFDQERQWRLEHPHEWLQQTRLYQALVDGLPQPTTRLGRRQLGRLAMRARHWSTCPRNRNLRTTECTCQARGDSQ